MKKNFVFKRSGAWRKIMSMLCILSVGSLVAFAQKQVSGSVTDAGGEPLAGASVMEKGTTNGSMTDIDGKFTLSNVGNNAVLQVSFVGFVTQETPVGNASTLKIILTEDMQALEEVVVIGYGTVRRQDYTGSVSSVKLENSAIATLPNLHILEALKGNVSGLNVGGISTAGGDADLLIRGQNSINGDNKPLIILDGMIFMGNMTDINPNDIANIDVLKDAVAAAAYGSRSANGVISISTKKGHTDKPVITFNASAGIHTWANNKPQLANGKDWLANTNAITGREADNVAFLLPEIQELVAQGKDRNMLNMIIHTGNLQDYQLAVSGTGKGINYYLSTSYEKSHGVFIGDTYNRISVLGKINTDISDWLNIGLDAGFSRRDYSGVSADFGGMMSGSPYFISIHEVDPATYTHWVTSPLWGIDDGFRDNIDFRHNFRLNTHATVSVPWIKGLSYRLSFLPNWDLTREGDFFYETYYQNTAPGPFTPEVLQSYLTRANGNRTNTRKYNYVWDNIITYKNYFGKHNVEATLVATRDYDKYDLEGMSGSDFSDNGNTTLGLGGLHKAKIQRLDFNTIKRTNIGYLGRFSYGYDGKYYFTASYRRDGASVFGARNKWGNFAAAGIAWRITEERFMEKFKPLNNLKLKFSWGQNGNQGISPYATLSQANNGSGAGNFYEFSDTGEKVYYGIIQTTLGNANLGWESTDALNTGFESAWLGSRLFVDVDFYHSQTRDQIFERVIPSMTGFSRIYASMGQVNNTGIDITVRSVNLQNKNLTWTTGLTFWKNNNKLVKLYGEDLDGDGKEDDDIASNLFIGKSLGAIYGYKQVGIVQEDDTEYIAAMGTLPGNPKYDDMVDGTPGLTPDDRTILGYQKENFRLNVSSTLRYRDFELYVMAVGIFGGNDRYLKSNPYAFRQSESDRNTIDEMTIFHRPYWTPENRNNTYPHVKFKNDGRFLGLQDRTWMRIQDISLSYMVNMPWVKSCNIRSLKIFLAAKNVAVFTNWFGTDPELGTGWMDGTYPVMASYSLGANFSF